MLLEFAGTIVLRHGTGGKSRVPVEAGLDAGLGSDSPGNGTKHSNPRSRLREEEEALQRDQPIRLLGWTFSRCR